MSQEPSVSKVELPDATLPARKDWLDATLRLATSWVGLFVAYASALAVLLIKSKELKQGLQNVGLPPWLALVLIAAFPLLAFVSSTIPALIEQRRIERYSKIRGSLQPGYFTLHPRQTEEGFKRADNAHIDVLSWIKNSKEPVLYLTGASGTGKSSLLSAWVIPKLQRENTVIIQVRGYEDICAKIKEEILRPGMIWDRVPTKTDDLRVLLDRACERLGARRLIIVVDQFEEFLILKDEDQQRAFRNLLLTTSVKKLTFLLVYRPEYEGLIQDHSWPKLQLDTNRKIISPFTESAAQEFIQKSGLVVNADLMRAVLREATEIEQGLSDSFDR